MRTSPPPADLFRAFADPTRLRILNLLLEAKEMCVCDLCATLQEGQPKVSRHLGILRRAGLVAVRPEGRWKHYSLTDAPSPLHHTLLRCARSCLGEVPELRADRARLKRLALGLRCSPAPRARAR
jgi:ArsR family transcriptional regulator